MQKNKSHHGLLLLILLPPILAACLCVALLTPRVVNFFNSSAYPDYLWSLRITRELSNKGYPVHDVSVFGSEPPGFRTIDVQIGNLIGDEQQRSYELVKDVHLIIMGTLTKGTSHPEPVDVIVVMLIDYSSGSYTIAADYESVQRFFAGGISEQEYFEHWSYPNSTPGITPP